MEIIGLVHGILMHMKIVIKIHGLFNSKMENAI